MYMQLLHCIIPKKLNNQVDLEKSIHESVRSRQNTQKQSVS